MYIQHLDIILPITLLLLAFLLKLSIDRSIEAPNLIQALCELPVDMVFLAISFLVAYTISKNTDTGKGLFYCFAFLLLAIVVVILWRKSLRLFETKNYYWIALLFINLVLSSFSLYQSMDTLINQVSKEQTEKKVHQTKAEEDGNK